MHNNVTAVLLADLKMDSGRSPHQWRHIDGRPMTNDELNLLLDATAQDLDEAAQLIEMRLVSAEAGLSATEQLLALLEPYFVANPTLTTTGEIFDVMTHEDRREFVNLIKMMEATK